MKNSNRHDKMVIVNEGLKKYGENKEVEACVFEKVQKKYAHRRSGFAGLRPLCRGLGRGSQLDQ